MKKQDIKRLEKAAEHFGKIVEILDKAYDSIESGDTEYITMGDRNKTKINTRMLVADLLTEAKANEIWLKSKIEQIKEQLLIK